MSGQSEIGAPLALAPAALNSVEAATAPSPGYGQSVLVVVTSDAHIAVPDGCVRTWGAADIPNFADFRTLVLEVPGDSEAFDAYRSDLRLAELAGVDVIWLAGPSANPALLSEISGAETHHFRHPVSASQCDVVDRRFAVLFAKTSHVHHAFQVRGDFLPIAYRGTADLTTALVRETARGVTIIVPPPSDPNAYSAFVETVSGLRRRGSPAQQVIRRLMVGLLAPVVIVSLLTALRYTQRGFNERYLQSKGWQIDHLLQRRADSALRYSRDDIEKFLQVRDGTLLDDSTRDGDALEFYEYYGLWSKADAYARAALARREPAAIATRNPMEQYASEIYDQMIVNLDRQLYEPARYQAQKYLNVTKTFPSGAYIYAVGEQLDTARKVAGLIRANYIYDKHPALHGYIRHLVGDQFSTLSFDERTTAPRHPSVIDNVAYADLAITAGERTYADQADQWREFQVRYPTSDFAADAAFSEITSRMNSYHGLSDQELMDLNDRTIGLVDEFVRRFPNSALADDAIYYKMRMSLTIVRDDLLWSSIDELAKRPNSDYGRRFAFTLATLWKPQNPVTQDGHAFKEYVFAVSRSAVTNSAPPALTDQLQNTLASVIGLPVAETRGHPATVVCRHSLMLGFGNYDGD